MVSTKCFDTPNAARPPTLVIILKTQRWRSGKHKVLRYAERSASVYSRNTKNAEMAEWSNAHDSKSCYGQLYGGSNPSLCAKKGRSHLPFFWRRESRKNTCGSREQSEALPRAPYGKRQNPLTKIAGRSHLPFFWRKESRKNTGGSREQSEALPRAPYGKRQNPLTKKQA